MFDLIKRLLGRTDCKGCVYRRCWGLYCGKRGGMLPHSAWQRYGCWHYAEDEDKGEIIDAPLDVIHDKMEGGVKYRLTDETKRTEFGVVLHRICALRDIQRWGVCKGDIGGWVESESNLSQDGDAWISENAMVYGNALVYDDAMVYGNALVYGDAKVYGNAVVNGDAVVYGKAVVYGDAVVRSSADYLVFKNSWSSYRWFTYTRSNKMWKVGCFYGTGEELIKKAYADSNKSGRCYEAIVRAVEAIESTTAKEGCEK